MDIEKLVECGAQIFCCDASCASTYDGRPCSAGAHQVRTSAVIALTLKAVITEEANVTNGDILLAAGEMSADELRTVRAALNWRVSRLRTIAAQVEKTNG